MFLKQRKWDENIGKLIVFAVTIIIAVGVLWTLAYFYNQNKKVEWYMSVLASVNSSSDDLKAIWVCDSSTGKILYDGRIAMYGVDCAGMTDTQKNEVKSVKWIQKADCSNSPGILSGKAEYCYFINKS